MSEYAADECKSAGNAHSANALATMRKAMSLTQAELADALGVVPKTVHRWEKQLRVLELSHMRQIAPLLGCRVVDFLPPSDLEKPRIRVKAATRTAP